MSRYVLLCERMIPHAVDSADGFETIQLRKETPATILRALPVWLSGILMNIDWSQLLEAQDNSMKTAGAFFVTFAIVFLGYNYEISPAPKVSISNYVIVFSVFALSGSVLVFTLIGNTYEAVRSFLRRMKKSLDARRALEDRGNLIKIELVILLSFVGSGNDSINAMSIAYIEEFTKLELSAAVGQLERKGMVKVHFDRDYCSITAAGRDIALAASNEIRENA